MKNNDPISWNVIEQVAGLIEKALTPDAKVQHNIRLPVIGKKRKRQCDVVITYGSEPRPTISIVEVQKRQRKPDINTFHGWYRKKQEVGAQHLICVSMKGYPKSIIDEVANTYGPTVKLLSLDELQKPSIPGLEFVLPYIINRSPKFKLLKVGTIKVDKYPGENANFNADDKIFTAANSKELLSLGEIITLVLRKSYSNTIADKNKYELTLSLDSMVDNLRILIDGNISKVLELKADIEIYTVINKIPLKTYKYQQEMINGVLAWVAIAEGIIDNQKKSVRMVFGKNENGFLQIQSVLFEGVESMSLIYSNNRNHIERYVEENFNDNKG